LSKLFDQLKDAARSREEKSPGILADALKRQHQRQAGEAGPPFAPAEATAAIADPARAQATPEPPQLLTRLSHLSGVGLAILIFLVAVLAWRSAPFTPPRKLKIDPSELKLDRNLDPGRISPKGTSPAGRPS
jgi:hypothetical protein